MTITQTEDHIKLPPPLSLQKEPYFTSSNALGSKLYRSIIFSGMFLLLRAVDFNTILPKHLNAGNLITDLEPLTLTI
jgi:hypothetical protein